MFASPASRRSAVLIATVAIATLSACATPASTDAPAAPSASTAPLVPGQEASFEGTIASVDTNPWAYDGNAVVMVATGDGRTVHIALPARWNLCKAEPLGDVQALEAGDRVHVAGTVDQEGNVVVCAQPQHHLRRAE